MSLLSKPVLFDPFTGEVTRRNPSVPERALAARKVTALGGLQQSGVGRIDWKAAEAIIADWNANERTPTESIVYKFVAQFRLVTPSAEDKTKFPASRFTDAFVASNAKTDKPRQATGRDGQIMGLALFPHFYPNVLGVVPDEFLDKNDVVDFVQLKKTQPGFAANKAKGERLRTFFNAFDGSTKDEAASFTGVSKVDLLDFCTGSSEACRSTCLVLSGNNPASTPAVAKKANLTRALLASPEVFAAGLFIGLDDLSKRLAKRNIDTVVRLNMLSDIPWYEACPELLEELANPARGDARVYFYDYTKLPFWTSARYKALGSRIGLTPAEVLDLTFSFSGDKGNATLCRKALDLRDAALGYPEGVRIAVAFAAADPTRGATGGYEGSRTTWEEILYAGQSSGHVRVYSSRPDEPVINLPGFGPRLLVDGDGSDYRVDDPGGCIVALNFKQPSVSEQSVKGITRRIGASRETFTAKVPSGGEWISKHRKAVDGVAAAQEVLDELLADGVGGKKLADARDTLRKRQALLQKVEAMPRPRRNPLPVVQSQSALTGDAPEAIAEGLLKFPMFQVGEGLFIGPHVPTVLED